MSPSWAGVYSLILHENCSSESLKCLSFEVTLWTMLITKVNNLIYNQVFLLDRSASNKLPAEF